MKGKKLILIALILVLTFAATACGSANNSNTSSNTSSSTATVSEPAASTATETTAKLPPLELSAILPIWEAVPDMNNGWWSRFFAETNTKWNIEWVPAADLATKFDLVLSSGSLPDIFWGEDVSRPTLVSAEKQGAFWDLTPIFGDFSKYPNLKNNMTPNVFKMASVDGKYYGIPRNRPQIDQGLKIRKDWLEKLNMEMPKNLDEFHNYLKAAVSQKLGGPDTTGIPTLTYFENVLVGGFGAYDIQKNSEGNPIYWMLNDGYTDSAEYLRQLYSEGLMPKEYFTLTYSDFQGFFTTGRAAAYVENIWRDYDQQTKIQAVQPEAQVETVVDMTGPKGYVGRIEKGFFGAFFISKQVPEDKLNRIIDYFELTCTDYWLQKGYYGWKDVHYTEAADGTRTMTDLGKTEVSASGIQQPLPMMQNTWAKVVMPSAPKEYNDAKLAHVTPILSKAKINPFEVLNSPTWTKLWGKSLAEFNQKRTEAICGQISMDEYRNYVTNLRESPEAKQAFKEFAADYASKFGQ